MTNQKYSRETILDRHGLQRDGRSCACGWAGFSFASHIAEILDQGRTVETVNDLKELPRFTVLRDADQEIWEIWSVARASRTGAVGGRRDEIKLPAVILWHPEDEQEN